MAVSKAHVKATNKYNAKAYDNLRIVVKKGRKADIQAHAERQGESLNAFVGRAIEEAMMRDAGAIAQRMQRESEVTADAN